MRESVAPEAGMTSYSNSRRDSIPSNLDGFATSFIPDLGNVAIPKV